jgi:hypothetical protein
MTGMKRESDRAWIWTTKAVTQLSEGEATVSLHGGDHRAGSGERERLDAQVVIPSSGRRSDKATRLDALKRLRTLIDQEISDLSGPSAHHAD